MLLGEVRGWRRRRYSQHTIVVISTMKVKTLLLFWNYDNCSFFALSFSAGASSPKSVHSVQSSDSPKSTNPFDSPKTTNPFDEPEEERKRREMENGQ